MTYCLASQVVTACAPVVCFEQRWCRLFLSTVSSMMTVRILSVVGSASSFVLHSSARAVSDELLQEAPAHEKHAI